MTGDQLLPEFRKFGKIPRFNREIVITEKIDGTNGVVYVTENGLVFAGSRKRWLTIENDNYGFAAWVWRHQGELVELGPGFHYGEWYGRGIQRNYGLDHRRWALFNVGRWNVDNPPPTCCDVVPTLSRDPFPYSGTIPLPLSLLKMQGSVAVPGFMNPEGIVIYHTAAKQLFKITLEGDGKPKGKSQ